MAYSISDLKQDLEGITHGTTINKITNIDSLIYRAAGKLLRDLDPQETKRTTQLPNPIFDEVFDYALPVDLKGNKIIDLKPQVNRTLRDRYVQTYNQNFDLLKNFVRQPQFTIDFNNSLKTIRISAPQLLVGITLNQADSVTDNGLWTVGGTASNLTADNVNFISSSSSLKFDLAAGGDPSTGFLENSTMTPVNLTEHENQSVLFIYTFLPVASDFTTGVELRWGSSPTDYWSRTVLTTQEGTAFQNGWNLLAFDWNGATVTGVPDVANVNYLRVSWIYNGIQQTAVRLDSVVSRLGNILEIEYYSKFLFRDAVTGAFKETVTSDNDLINLDTETYSIFTSLCAYYVVQQIAGVDGGFDASYFDKEYKEGLTRYKAMYKSEVQKPQQYYYTQDRPMNYRRWFNRRNP